jgi:SAM-dependent methyltransferase
MEEVVNFYEHLPDEASEAPRLSVGLGQLELARTREVILRHLPPPPQTILDIGGAAGAYSGWLGGLGYHAQLIDPVARHVHQARQDARIARAEIGDARQIERPDESADAVLLMGPLYHLTEREDRLRAVHEARRVLRPGGLLFAAAIVRFASLLDGLARGFLDDPRFDAIVEEDLRTGQHRNPTGDPAYFTSAFFHLPEELRTELLEAGLSVVELVGVEGPGWLAANFEERWADPARRQRLLDLVRSVEHEPALLGFSPHLLAVATR